jgi:hypothetical protein
MRLSNSKAKTWRRCPKQYEFKYVHKLRPKRKKAHLELGTWVHELLMVYYDGEDWKARHRQLKAKFKNLFEEEREELGDLPGEALRLFKSYLRHYEKEDAEHRTIDTEIDEIIELPNGLKFQFIIDRIYEDRDGLWLQDHKAISKFMPSDFMLLDAQLTRYFYCAEKMGYTPLLGVEFNEIRIKPPTIPETLKSGFLTQKKNIDTDYWTYLKAIKDLDQEPKLYVETLRRLWERDQSDSRFFRRSRLPRDKPVTRTMMRELTDTAHEIKEAEKRGRFPRTPDKSCQWMCDYIDLCVMELHGGDISSTVKMRYDKHKRNEEDG